VLQARATVTSNIAATSSPPHRTCVRHKSSSHATLHWCAHRLCSGWPRRLGLSRVQYILIQMRVAGTQHYPGDAVEGPVHGNAGTVTSIISDDSICGWDIEIRKVLAI